MLYRYLKATPQAPSPGKFIPRYVKIIPTLISSIGLGIVASVIAPMFSYQVTQFFNDANQESGLITPIIYESFASESQDKDEPVLLAQVDFTKATNWFTFSGTVTGVNDDLNQQTDSIFVPIESSVNQIEKNSQVDTNIAKVKTYSLSIPSLGIGKSLVDLESDDLSKHLVHYKNTAIPGQFGSPVVFGHSTLPQFFNPSNYLTIFATLPTIKVGSDVFVEYGGVSYTYRVARMYEVKPTDVWVLKQDRSSKSLKLITCVPPGTKLRRLVVEADLQKEQL